jgi:hypothetical protein
VATAATWCAGTAVLGRAFASPPGSRDFYVSTSAVAGVWAVGSVPHIASRRDEVRLDGRQAAAAVATGGAAFAAFYGAALVARRIPPLDAAIGNVLAYAQEGDTRLVLATTLASGVGEELYFRGTWYDVLGGRRPVLSSTAAHVVSTAATRNPALLLASVVMGGLFALQRRATGGVVAPAITHLTWSALMVRFVTPLFRPDRATPAAVRSRGAGSRPGARSRRRSARPCSPGRGTSA